MGFVLQMICVAVLQAVLLFGIDIGVEVRDMCIDFVVAREICTHGSVYLATDPMSIIGQSASDEEKIDAAKRFGAASLFETVQSAVVILAIITILCSLMAMLFIGKAEMIAEKKQDIMHKLLIVFIVGSFISILNMVMYFIESVVVG